MARGIPILISDDQPNKYEALKPISFMRDDAVSFDENLLQSIVDETPNVLPIRDFYPAISSVCSLGREIPLDLGEKQGFIDNLLVTNDGHLVLVETKLYRNPEAIREVVVQTLQYGMTVNKIPLSELEARIKRGDRKSSILAEREFISIRDCVMELAKNGKMESVPDEFEEALERFQRTGEMLLLIVADGIHASVERITQWMNEITGSSPFTFGLVELRFYLLPDGRRVAIPRTLLRTKEVSRHVVVVDIQNKAESTYASATVFDTSGKSALGEPRTVKSATPMLTKATLLEAIQPSARPIASSLIDQLESIGLEYYGTKIDVRYGVVLPQEGEKPQCLFCLASNGVWAWFTKKLLDTLGLEAINDYKSKMNRIATFWRSDQMETTQGGVLVRYELIKDKIPEIVSVLEEFKLRAINAIPEQSI